MRFAFSDEQRDFQRGVRAALDKQCPPSKLRAAWASVEGQVPGLWAGLGALGVLGLTVPEALGGLGMDELDQVLVMEETGRAAVPGPIVDTVVGARLLADVAPDLAARWLPELAAGRAALALSLEGGHLVADAHLADLLLIQRGTELHAVPRAQTRLVAEASVDGSRRLFRVEWAPGEGTLIATDARAALAGAYDRGALATSAQLLGIARHLLDVTVEYVKVRKQFGKPIGSFQAVKHHLADAVLALEFAAPVVYRAAYSVARGDTARAVHVAMAKAYASDAAQLAAKKALQCHGAMGYAYEYDLHLWMKRAWALARSWGDAAWHRSRVAAALLDGPRLEDSDGRGIHHRRGQNPGGQAERGAVQGPPS